MSEVESKDVVYEFAGYRLDPAEHRFSRDGEAIPLPPKAFDTLVVLVENEGHLVSKSELLDRVWADAFVEEGNLKISIHTLRNALVGSKFIETVPKKGYRFNAPVNVIHKSLRNVLIEKDTVATLSIGTRSGDATRSLRVAPRTAAVVAIVLLSVVGYFFGRKFLLNKAPVPMPLASVARIGVLPLRSLSAPPSDQELRVGLSDSIVTRLSSIRQIQVRPTSATLRYLDQDRDIGAIGKEQNVDAILDGTLQRTGDTISVNLQIIDVADRHVLWGDSFTADLSNVLNGDASIPTRVARNVALNFDSTVPDSSVPSSNVAAQDLFLRAHYTMATSARKIDTILKARDYLEQAIRIDDRYALAYAELANTYNQAASLNILAPSDAFPKSEEAVRKALEIDPNISGAHLALADVEVEFNNNWVAGEAEYKKALELNPGSAAAHQYYAEFLAGMGRFDEADSHSEIAHQIDPTAINIEAVQALFLFYAHRFDECITKSRLVLDKDPNAYLAWLYLSGAESEKGNFAEAIRAGNKAKELSGGAPPDVYVLGAAYALSHDDAKSNEMLQKLETMSHAQYVDPFFSAVIYAMKGDRNRSFEYLDRSRMERSYWLTTLKVHPWVDGLRSDGRFQSLLSDLKLN